MRYDTIVKLESIFIILLRYELNLNLYNINLFKLLFNEHS